MPVKPVLFPPSVQQRPRVCGTDAVRFPCHETGFQEFAYDAAHVSLVQAGAGGYCALPHSLGRLHEQPSRYAGALRSECAFRPSRPAEPVGMPQVLIEDAGNNDPGVSRQVQPGKFGLCTTLLCRLPHVRDCQERSHLMGEAALGHPQLTNCIGDWAQGARPPPFQNEGMALN